MTLTARRVLNGPLLAWLLCSCSGEAPPPPTAEEWLAAADQVRELDGTPAAAAAPPATSGGSLPVVDIEPTLLPGAAQPLTGGDLDLYQRPAIPAPAADGYLHLEWEHLLPADAGLDLMSSGLSEEVLGRKVRLPGYVVPLDLDSERAYRMLLVPYIGACIHVPPPPPNQLVYAQFEDGYRIDDMWEPVFLYGVIAGEGQQTDLGEAGYAMEVDKITPFVY